MFLSIEPFLIDKISHLLKNTFNLSPTKEQQNISFLVKDNSLASIVMSIYIAIGVPIIEEIIFRGFLHNYFEITTKESSQNKVSSNNGAINRLEKIKTILKTSLIFGLMHFSPLNGWTNISIITITTFIGIITSILKEKTNDLWASVSFHCTNNTIAILQLRQTI